MSTPMHMSREEFDENKQDILAAVDALINNPESRRRFRDFALYEETTGELLAEVFRTPVGPVVIHRGTGRFSKGRNSAVPFVRQGRGSDELIVAPLTSDPDQRFLIIANTGGSRAISGRDLMQWLAEGKTQHAIDRPTEDRRPPSEIQELLALLADNVDLIAARPDAGEFYHQVDQMVGDIVRVLNGE